MAEFEPANIPRPGLAQDPGVRMRPSTTLPSQIRDPIGGAIAQLGGEISGIADTFRALALQRQGADDQVFIDRYQLELNKRYSTIEAESVNSPDAANPNYVNMLDKRLADTQKNVYDELTGTGQFNVSMEGRRKAEHAAMEMRAGTARRAAVAAHNQRVTGYVNSVNENILEVSRVAGANGDIEGNLARVDSSVNSLRGVLAPDKLEALRRASRATVVESVVQGLRARNQFDEARRLIDSERGYAANSNEGVIASAAAKYGIDPAYLVSTGRIESGMQNIPRHSKDPNQTASGIFGFTAGTARQYGLPENASQATLAQQADAAARLAAANKRVLVNTLGRDPTNGELYLAHFLGAGDAAKVLSAPPGTPIEAVVGGVSIKNNRGVLEGRTVGDVTRWAEGKMISFGGGGADRYLDDATRRRLLSAVETSQHQSETRRESQMTKALKDAGDSFLREAFSRADSGKLDTDYVEQIRPFITPTEYKGLLTALRGESNVDDRAAVVDLMEKVDAEDEQQFMSRATNYVNEGKLKTTTFTSMVQRNRSARKDDAPASPFKAGREYINTSLDPGALSDASTAQPLRFGRANALIEFDNWMAANPQASREAAIAESQAIVKRYEPIAQENMMISLGTSRYFNGATRSQLRAMSQESRAEMLDRAEETLFKDKERLTAAQYQYERRLLENWRQVLSRAPVTQPTPVRRP